MQSAAIPDDRIYCPVHDRIRGRSRRRLCRPLPPLRGGGGGEDRAEFGDGGGYGYGYGYGYVDADCSPAVVLPKEDEDRTNEDVITASFSAASASSLTSAERRLTTTYDTLLAGTYSNTRDYGICLRCTGRCGRSRLLRYGCIDFVTASGGRICGVLYIRKAGGRRRRREVTRLGDFRDGPRYRQVGRT